MTIVGAKPPPERRFLGQLGTQRLPQLGCAGISAGQKSVANRESGARRPSTPTNVKNDFDIQKNALFGARGGAAGHDKYLGIDVSLPVARRKAVQQRATRTLSRARWRIAAKIAALLDEESQQRLSAVCDEGSLREPSALRNNEPQRGLSALRDKGSWRGLAAMRVEGVAKSRLCATKDCSKFRRRVAAMRGAALRRKSYARTEL